MKTSWYLYRKINFKLLINNQLGPTWRANISKMFGYLFLSALGPQPNISTWAPYFFSFYKSLYLHSASGSVASLERGQVFNLSSNLHLSIGSVHQSYAAGTSLQEELIALSSLGTGDFILRGIVHQLKILELSKFDARSPTMAQIIAIYQKHTTT